MNMVLYFALGWLGLLVLAANAGVAVPDGLGLVVVALTLWAIGYLYYRLCRRWPIAGWLGLGFLVALPLFVFLYVKLYGGGWLTAILLTAVTWGFLYGVYDNLLSVPWPKPWIGFLS